jgi:hypothetical protein
VSRLAAPEIDDAVGSLPGRSDRSRVSDDETSLL